MKEPHPDYVRNIKALVAQGWAVRFFSRWNRYLSFEQSGGRVRWAQVNWLSGRVHFPNRVPRGWEK